MSELQADTKIAIRPLRYPAPDLIYRVSEFIEQENLPLSSLNLSPVYCISLSVRNFECNKN